MRVSFLALLVCVSLVGCKSDPEPSRDDLGLLFGSISAKGPTGLPRKVEGGDYDEGNDGKPLPADTVLVDYDKPGPAVVELRGAAGAGGGSARLTIGLGGFDRELVVIGVGGTIEFHNTTGNNVALIGTIKGKTVLEVEVPAGGKAWTQAREAGVMELTSFDDEEVLTQVYVAAGPYALIRKAAREYQIDGLPPGEYEVVAWHPRFPPITGSVSIEAGVSTRFDLAFGVSGRLPTVEKQPAEK